MLTATPVRFTAMTTRVLPRPLKKHVSAAVSSIGNDEKQIVARYSASSFAIAGSCPITAKIGPANNDTRLTSTPPTAAR